MNTVITNGINRKKKIIVMAFKKEAAEMPLFLWSCLWYRPLPPYLPTSAALFKVIQYKSKKSNAWV